MNVGLLYARLKEYIESDSDAINWEVVLINHKTNRQHDGVVSVESTMRGIGDENKLFIIPEKLMTLL
jgi:hypothetical protein